jgi:endonuclease/exonuclease/phosphatase family metal-dependent hydrolase
MKVLQLNIWMGKLKRSILDLIEAEQPDILCLQEVFASDEKIVLTQTGMFSILDAIQETTGYQYCFFSPTFSQEVGGVKVDFGNAILSNRPLTDQKTVFINQQYEPNLDVTKLEPNIRNLQLASLDIGGKRVTIGNHHGYWVGGDIGDVGDTNTVEALQKVAQELQTVDGPLIFCGDLNVRPESPAMRAFDGFLEDLVATNGIDTTLTELGFPSPIPCDHILVSDDVQVLNFTVSDRLASDHKALLLEFDI